MIAELTRIARTESASENSQPFAHFPLIGAGNCRAGVPPIWKFSGEIDEGATAKLRICELLRDGLKERLDLPRPAVDEGGSPAMTASNPTEHNKALVLAGIKGVFVDRDPTVLDRLFGDDYRQHNPSIPNGTAAIKAVLKNLPANFSYEPGLVVADGDYVMVHGRYVGWGPKPMVGVDIFRVANGKIAEHWDVLQEEVPAAQSANGNSMFTGPQR